MIIDNQLETRTDWETKVGPDIGGPTPFVAPDAYGSRMASGAWQLSIHGKPWTCWMAAQHRPLLPNTGHLVQSFNVMTDLYAETVAQALEFDCRISAAGMDYNHSFQINYSTGMLQISDQAGKWQNIGIQYGKLYTRRWYAIRLQYAFDTTRLKYHTESIQINDEVFYPALPELSAVKLGWSDGAHIQTQMDLNGLGGGYSIYVKGMQLEWS